MPTPASVRLVCQFPNIQPSGRLRKQGETRSKTQPCGRSPLLSPSVVTPGRLWLQDLYTGLKDWTHSCGKPTVKGSHHLLLGRAVLSEVWALEAGALEPSVCLNTGWGPLLTPSEEIGNYSHGKNCSEDKKSRVVSQGTKCELNVSHKEFKARPGICLPLRNLQRLLGLVRARASEREFPLTSLSLAQFGDIQGGQGWGWAATRENERYRRGTLFPRAHSVICLICLWVEVGRREGSVQKRAMRSSVHRASLADQLSS